MSFIIEEELAKLPSSPGVYLMHDATEEIIYVGKAVSLKNRVRQYFRKSTKKGAKISKMVTQIASFEYIMTDTELEALILECNLIKEHRPKYNTLLKDDKSYPFIKVTPEEKYPRILFAHRVSKDKAKYFGPYVGPVKDTVDLLRKTFTLRSCNKKLDGSAVIGRPCLYYHMGQCPAPCQANVPEEEYKENVNRLLSFLNGDHSTVVREFKEKMQEASDRLDFEQAAHYRDMLKGVKAICERQKAFVAGNDDRDILAIAQKDEDSLVQMFMIRDGKLIGRERYPLAASSEEDNAKRLQSFLQQYYTDASFIPSELCVSESIEDMELLGEWLTSIAGHKVEILCPKRGNKARLTQLAKRNANLTLGLDMERMKREEHARLKAVSLLAELLKIPELRRIEAYDISNISGYENVGSMVVYDQGEPKRNDYRKFRIKSVDGPNDYASMKEMLTRRFERLEKGDAKFTSRPQLLLIDGGKGQVHAAKEAVEKYAPDIPICGMVKDDRHKTRALFFMEEEIPLKEHPEVFALVTRIQDETHRFAVTYHHLLHSKVQTHSVLEDIPGVGPKRRAALIRSFDSIDKIKEASIEELEKIPQIDHRCAVSIYAFFHSEKEEKEAEIKE